MSKKLNRLAAILALTCAAASTVRVVEALAPAAAHPLVRSAHDGPWSSPETWENHHVPAAGSRVVIRPGHRVTYDVASDQPIYSVRVAGTLAFAPDRDTRLDVGLLVVRAGEDEVPTQEIIGTAGHHHDATTDAPVVPATNDGPTLEVGTANHPVDAAHRALIRLTYQEGLDKDAAPALIDAGGRMELHGAPMPRTWLKLADPARAGDAAVTLDDVATGWRVGDRVVVVSTAKLSMFDHGQVIPSVRDKSQTEERIVTAVDGKRITLDRPLGYDHAADRTPAGDFRGEVADLSRNVVVESADPAGVRGHTMYHRNSTGSVSYAEFRHLGKDGALGRYSLHFHLCGDTMRGASVLGASIWDSANHWLTVHGTNFLVVRDCVGYGAQGHGFFLEDGTEEYNVFDRNLAVQALHHDPLPDQVLPFDHNDGAGFWWANSRNAFTRNVAAECDQYGYRLEAGRAPGFDSNLSVRQPDGSRAKADVRALPFIRFDDNEAHTQRRFALDLGGTRMVAGNDAYTTDADGHRTLNRANTNVGDVGDAGPDYRHPFVVRNLRVWASQWSYHSFATNVLVDGLTCYNCDYGIWRTRMAGAQFKNLSMQKIAQHDIFVPFGGAPDYDDTYNKSLKPTDDFPPSTVITGYQLSPLGDLIVCGTTVDDGTVTTVRVNGQLARAVEPNFLEWEARVPQGAWSPGQPLKALATDAAGNTEPTPHVLPVRDGH